MHVGKQKAALLHPNRGTMHKGGEAMPVVEGLKEEAPRRGYLKDEAERGHSSFNSTV